MTRVLSGIVLILVFGGAAWWAPPPWLLAIATAVAVAGTIEYAGIAARLGAPVPLGPTLAATATLCVAVGIPGLSPTSIVTSLVIAAGALAVAHGRPAPDTLVRVAATVFGPLYVGLPLGALVAVRWTHGREAALVPLLVVIASDTAQYYTGRAFGRRPLAPAVSPKKTIEGAIGGLAAGSLVTLGLTRLWVPELPAASSLVLGAALVALGITGDLFESLLKRAAGVKDSSAVIPGHGGVLDRIDALLFVAPVYYAVVTYLVPVR